MFTQDEVLKMAIQAGFDEHHAKFDTRIEAFAKLVAAAAASKEQEKFSADLIEYGKAMAAVEREACAKVCESKMTGINPLGDDYREECAEAIRSRGQQ